MRKQDCAEVARHHWRVQESPQEEDVVGWCGLMKKFVVEDAFEAYVLQAFHRRIVFGVITHYQIEGCERRHNYCLHN